MAVLVWILLSLLVLQCDHLVKSKEEDLNNHQKLAEWVKGNGGVVSLKEAWCFSKLVPVPAAQLISCSFPSQIKFEIAQLCPTCVRGAYATEDFKKGDMIARVPFNVSIKMPADVDYAGVSISSVIIIISLPSLLTNITTSSSSPPPYVIIGPCL